MSRLKTFTEETAWKQGSDANFDKEAAKEKCKQLECDLFMMYAMVQLK